MIATDQLKSLYNIFSDHPKVSTDSRSIKAGSIFFALHGKKFDGNIYAVDALEMGAVVAVVDNSDLEGKPGMFYVKDTLVALQQLARWHRENIKAPVIALTGSNGKTTTKELITAVLSSQYPTFSTQGNLNNHIGVPLTILSVTDDVRFCIVEMGANHRGEIALLCSLADPDFGLITNIGKAHLEGFGDFKGVIKAKSELYDYIRAKNRKVFVNNDNPLLMKVAKNIDLITYGKDRTNYCSGNIIGSFPYLSLNVNFQNDDLEINSKLVGNYNAENILAAVCIGFYFDVEPQNIVRAIENYAPQNNRSQMIKTDRNTLIMDAYNANPTSMKASIENFVSQPFDNKVVILGEMKELGDESSNEHQILADTVNKYRTSLSDAVFIGSGFLSTNLQSGMFFVSTEAYIEYIHQYPVSGKTILIKGSRANRLERLINLL